jgi:FtsP/CotA-like multicopper oxidase with cupredoxin domain
MRELTLQSSIIVDESHNRNYNFQEPSFVVSPGEYHRFRVVGAMEETVLRVSIDDHKLFVVATDGYLTEPFEADIVHLHAGEL